MVNIVKKIVPESRYYLKCPYEMTPTRIVVHNTANDAPARNEISYMTNNDYETSFHYAVDDKEIVQGLPENRNGWHASDGNGKGNREGIAIEICYSLSGGDRFIKAEQNAVDLIVDILNRYNWDIDKVTKHQDYTNKYCPHRTLDMGWDRFLNMINEKLSETRARPFIVGTKIYNTEDIYLTETAGYGGGQMLLTKNTESIVKKYHYNKGLYMALGTENTYYDAAWTNNYSKFTTTKPPVEELKEVITGIRNARAKMNVHPSKKSKLIFVTKKYANIIKESEEFLKKLGFGEEIEIRENKENIPQNAVSIVSSNLELFIPFEDLVDIKEEIERLEKEKAKVLVEKEKTDKMLSNPGFVAKAPAAKVEEEKEKQAKFNEMIKTIEERIQGLK